MAAEDKLLTLYREARVDHDAAPSAPVPHRVVAAAVAWVSAAMATERDDPGVCLSEEQVELAPAVTGCSDRDYPGRQSLSVHFVGRGTVTVDSAYLNHAFDDGRVGGLAHAYAITADRAAGSTMHAARAVATAAPAARRCT